MKGLKVTDGLTHWIPILYLETGHIPGVIIVALLLTTPVLVLFGELTVVLAMTGVWTPINNAIVQILKYFL
tara:strand:- start:293 stop:505 length:213 start_codon:yes stop_codon:yes gene_type:complete